MILIDDVNALVIEQDGEGRELARHPLASAEAFALVSRAWLRAGWDTKYVYSFTWFGRPVIQLPEDLIRIQEVVWTLKPDVIIETGVAHGGGLVFFASLFKAMGRGRVIGVELDLRPHNRAAIAAHPLADLISIVDGSSTDPDVVARVRAQIAPGETVLAVLDSNHTGPHVLAELQAYGPLVSPGSYIVATDGIMGEVVGAPRSSPDWATSNPQRAARDFVASNPDFAIEEPAWLFNEGLVRERVTYWPGAFVKRLR